MPTYIPWECFDDGETVDEILVQFPGLERADVLAAIAFEMGRIAEHESPSVSEPDPYEALSE